MITDCIHNNILVLFFDYHSRFRYDQVHEGQTDGGLAWSHGFVNFLVDVDAGHLIPRVMDCVQLWAIAGLGAAGEVNPSKPYAPLAQHAENGRFLVKLVVTWDYP